MIKRHLSILLVLFAILAMMAAPRPALAAKAAAPKPALAAKTSALSPELLRIALDWEHVKFEIENRDEQEQRMAEIAARAAKLAEQNPGEIDAQIWYGIIVSEQASMASENGSPVKALKLAYTARDILARAETADPRALDAGAPTSLGVLYYRVPGFPLGFGDASKARRYLEEAVKNAPNGLDANYFYADFLYEQKEPAEAKQVLEHLLSLPQDRDRPVWDKSRRLVAQELLAKIASNAQ